MSKIENSRIGVTIFLVDVLAVIFSWILSLYLTRMAGLYYPITSQEYGVTVEAFFTHLFVYSVLSCVTLFCFFNKGHYTKRIPWWTQVRYIIVVCFVIMLADGFITFSNDESLSNFFVCSLWLSLMFGILISRQLSSYLLRRNKMWNIHCIVMGDVESIVDVLFALDSDGYSGYQVEKIYVRDKEFTEFDRNFIPSRYKNIEVVDATRTYIKHLKDNKDKYVILAMDAFRGGARDSVMELFENEKIEYALVPPVKRASLHGMEPQYFFGYDVMFLSNRNKMRSPLGLLLKRLMDVSFSLIAILMLSPLLVSVSIMIKLSGGSIIYGQQRVGKNGHNFLCYKFRSMIPDADAVLKKLMETDPAIRDEYNQHQKLRNDPRITKVGVFIRKWSIDELPQLFNILKGDMSLVGPRPILPSEIDLYGKDLYKYYTDVKPGLTGLWQVSGRSDISYEQRVRLDNWYVKYWSIWHDVVIVFKTIKVVLNRSGAY